MMNLELEGIPTEKGPKTAEISTTEMITKEISVKVIVETSTTKMKTETSTIETKEISMKEIKIRISIVKRANAATTQVKKLTTGVIIIAEISEGIMIASSMINVVIEILTKRINPSTNLNLKVNIVSFSKRKLKLVICIINKHLSYHKFTTFIIFKLIYS